MEKAIEVPNHELKLPCFAAVRAEITLMPGSTFAIAHHAFSSGAGGTADGDGSHRSTSKTPSYTKSASWNITHLPLFSVADAFNFVSQARFEDIAFILKAAELNSALSQEGRKKVYGLNINGTLSAAVSQGIMSDDLQTRMAIETAAASDARMGGASTSAMSNFGSGNQGIAATMPVVVLARELDASEDELARALALSHLTAISIHSRFMRLSALCAASTAAMGAAAGMSWLFTRDLKVIETAIVNMISDVSGMICDGASNSCAMKVSSATSCALRSVLMARQGIRVGSNDGIVCEDTEQTINNLCRLTVHAMPYTDKEIIRIMSEKACLAES